MAKANATARLSVAGAAVSKAITDETPQVKVKAEFEYIGDDGGRWLFTRRSDGLSFTIDKPRGITLTAKTQPLSCRLTVRGAKFNETILKMVRK